MKILVPVKRVCDPDNANKVKISDDGSQVTALVVDAELPVGARALFEDLVHVRDLVADRQFVDHLVDQLQELEKQRSQRELAALSRGVVSIVSGRIGPA